jgi:carbamoyltransferase
MKKFYIGLSTTFHDPAIAVVNWEGEVIFAEASERYLQTKRAYCAAADLRETVRRIIKEYCDADAAFVVAKPWSQRMHNFMNLMELIGATNHERIPQRSQEMTKYMVTRDVLYSQLWLHQASLKLSGGHLADILRNEFGNHKVSYVKFPHHLAHAANASFTSPFAEAACLVADGQGEWGSMTYFHYKDGRLREVHKMKGEESLGIIYGICTGFCGFDSEKGEEWKVMGLAPYGQLDPEIHRVLTDLVKIDGLTIKYPSLRHIQTWFEKMKPKARKKNQSAMEVADLAYTLQYFYCEVMDKLLSNFYSLGISENLVLGGGCALNSSYNGQITARTKFKRLHVPSAPADDGNALGVALLAYYQDHPESRPRPRGIVQTPYLGTSVSHQVLENLVKFGRIARTQHLPGTIHEETARLLAEGKLVGWMQGRAEFGPRALGNRSILADPRPADLKDRINSLVKFREEFRPFAPSILDDFGDEYFEGYQTSPYMERTLTFKKSARERVPAIVHVNATGRLQSVRREWNERYYDLIHAFYRLTGIPMLLNTSFNIMGKPIIHSVEDAVGLFYTTGLDVLVVEDYLFQK